MSTVSYISHADCGNHDTGWGHPEHVGRLRAIPRALREDFDLYHELDHRESRHATVESHTELLLSEFQPDALDQMSQGAQLHLMRALVRNVSERLALANTRIK